MNADYNPLDVLIYLLLLLPVLVLATHFGGRAWEQWWDWWDRRRR